MDAASLKQYIFDHQLVESILESIGCHHIRYSDSKDYFVCANHDGDNPTAINVYNTPYLGMHNWTRESDFDEHADIISLTQYNKNCTFTEAVKFLHAIIGIDYVYEKTKKPEKRFDALSRFTNLFKRKSELSDDVLRYVDEHILDDNVPLLHIDWLREGVTDRTREKFGLTYSYPQKRVIIPLRQWQTGKLLGTNARTVVSDYKLYGIKKYFITPSYQKHLNVFGVYENKASIESVGHVVVYEAEKSVLKRDSLLDPTGVALSGHSMSVDQACILLRLNVNEIVIAMDKDVQIPEVWHICEYFYRVRKVSFIFDQDNLLGEKDSPADASIEVFDRLFEDRIPYDETMHNAYLRYINKQDE